MKSTIKKRSYVQELIKQPIKKSKRHHYVSNLIQKTVKMINKIDDSSETKNRHILDFSIDLSNDSIKESNDKNI